MAFRPDEATLTHVIVALMLRHTSGVSRFTKHELQAASRAQLKLDVETDGDVWATIDHPVIVDSPLED